MPTYGFRCEKCGPFNDMCTISNRNLPTECPECGADSPRDIEWELNTMSDFDETCKEHERYSWSMGCHPNQIAEMTRRYPGSEYRPNGQLRIKSRNHKLKMLKQRGMEEFDRGVKINNQ
jgi:putative FmdB family regulatory protein